MQAIEDHQPDVPSEEQPGKLASAKQLNFVLTAIAIVAAIAFGFGGAAWHVPSGLVLALAGAGAGLPGASRAVALCHLEAETRSAHWSCNCLYGLRVWPDRWESRHPFRGNARDAGVRRPGWAAVLRSNLSSRAKNSQFWGTIFGMFFLAGAYGWGLTAAADSVLDKSTPASFTTTVENMHESHGRSTSYHLGLAPWGPMQGPDDVSVSKTTYESTTIGSQVCLELHPGRLAVQWYRIVACDGRVR